MVEKYFGAQGGTGVVIDGQGADWILKTRQCWNSRMEGITLRGAGDRNAGTGEAALLLDGSRYWHFKNCAFEYNYSASDHGAIDFIDSYNTTFEGCEFRGNGTGGSGGALGIPSYMRATFINCGFYSKDAVERGGALLLNDPAFLIGCTFADNVAVEGGAVYISGYNDAPSCFDSCTFVGNSASVDGGAIWAVPTPVSAKILHITRCIIAYSGGGGAIKWGGYGYQDPSVMSCDIYGNAGGDWSDMGIENSYGNMTEAPLLCDIMNEDFGLLTGSPCLPESNSFGLHLGAWGEGCVPTSVVELGRSDMAGMLRQNHPNPFNPETRIVFSLRESAQVRLRVYDPSGALVSTLVDEVREMGTAKRSGC